MATSELGIELRRVVSAICERVKHANTDELSKALNISKSNIYRIRKGGTPSLATLELLAAHFDNGEQSGQKPLATMPNIGPAKPPAVEPPARCD